MGGITKIRLSPSKDIESMIFNNGETKAFLLPGKATLEPYFTYSTARVSSEPIENGYMFFNKISWRIPIDQKSLIQSLFPFIKGLCVIEITFSNSTVKIFGSNDIPLLLNFKPLNQGTVEDYNGLELTASNIDYLPGRFGSIITS